MSKKTKNCLIIATTLVLIGLIIFVSVMATCNWDFKKLSTVNYETNTYEIDEKFNKISINATTADILFAISDNETCKVVCYEMENEKHSVDVEDDTLTINVVNERKWYENINITISTQKITVYLPETEYTSLFIDTTTGEINLENISAETIDLSVSTGTINISDTKCKKLISSGSTGKIFMNNVIASEKFSIERSTGDVKFDNCDATEIFVKTSTGDVTGDFLTDKTFITNTSTGDVNVPKSTSGEKCEITTSTGDIKIQIN